MTPDNLRRLRDFAGITQTQAAALAGVSLRAWQWYESGHVRIPESRLRLVCLEIERLGPARDPATG